MAHVGTPADLAKQPAASTGRIDPWKPLFAAMVIIAMVAVVAMASAFLAGSNRVTSTGLGRAQIDDLQLPVAPAALGRAQIDDLQLPVAPVTSTGLSRAQIASLQQSVASTGLSRAQIASLQQSVASTGLPQSFAPADPGAAQSATLQQGIGRMVYQTAPRARHTRTPR